MIKNFNKVLTVNLGIVIVVVAVLIILISLLASDINRRTKTIQEIQKETAFRFKAVEVLAALKKDVKDARVQKVFLNVALPNQDKLINFPKDIPMGALMISFFVICASID